MRSSKRIIAMLVAFFVTFTMVGFGNVTKVSASYAPTVPTATINGYMKPYEAYPGDTIDVSIPVKVGAYTIKDPIITLDIDGLPFEIDGDIRLRRDGSKADAKVTNLIVNSITYVEFKLHVKDYARKNTYEKIGVHFLTTDSFNSYCSVELEQPCKFSVKVLSERVLPQLDVVEATYPDIIKPNDEFNVDLLFENMGDLQAEKVKITMSGITEAGLMAGEFYQVYEFERFPVGKQRECRFSYVASRTLSSGIKTLKADVSYVLDGKTYEASTPIYLQAAGADDMDAAASNIMKIESTSYPETVEKGSTFTVGLKYKSTADEDLKNVKIKLDGYDEAGFIPDFYYNTVEIGKLEPGKTCSAQFSLKAPASMGSGIKKLTAKIIYQKQTGATYNDNIYLYIEVPTAEDTLTSGMPKMLIQSYDIGTEKLMAGDEFVFNFDVVNSHSSAKANNIKVTVSSADNTFSIVQGSASFLIPSLDAGEVQNCSIPLKVKGDVATGGYDLTVTFDYEYRAYDDQRREVSKSNNMSEKLKIPVYSNDRPMVSNINVGYWDIPIQGELTTMSFEFYNMGKATLYNVTATVEGDFDAGGNMVVIGNVEPGSGKSWELDVTPMAEGYGCGTLHITYEDGNGNISEFDESFENQINGSSTSMYGYDDPNFGGDYGDFGDMPMDEGDQNMWQKFKALAVWKKILIGAGVVAVVVVTVVVIRKKKKKKDEFDLDDED